jgi:hypothetical protein
MKVQSHTSEGVRGVGRGGAEMGGGGGERVGWRVERGDIGKDWRCGRRIRRMSGKQAGLYRPGMGDCASVAGGGEGRRRSVCGGRGDLAADLAGVDPGDKVLHVPRDVEGGVRHHLWAWGGGAMLRGEMAVRAAENSLDFSISAR